MMGDFNLVLDQVEYMKMYLDIALGEAKIKYDQTVSEGQENIDGAHERIPGHKEKLKNFLDGLSED